MKSQMLLSTTVTITHGLMHLSNDDKTGLPSQPLPEKQPLLGFLPRRQSVPGELARRLSQPRGWGRLLGLIFAGYVSLASQNPYTTIVYSVEIL